MPESEAMLFEMRGITKTFPGIVANDKISFGVKPGEIHALLGENGAGKSTLMNVLTGLYRPDSGRIIIEGKERVFHSPRDSIACGIGMVHQHFKLVEAFTVAQNVVLGVNEGFFTNEKVVESKVRAFSERFKLEVEPSDKIWQLSVGERQRVEILKALYRDVKVLVLDEPTAVLTPQEAQALFGTLRAMADEGRAIIIITHKLEEVVEIAHRVTVIRRGKSVGTVGEDEINYRALSRLMIGEEIGKKELGEPNLGGDALVVQGVSAIGDRGQKALDDISFTLREGEILGVAGVAGNGQRELCEALAGMRKVTGTITVNGFGGIENKGVKRAISSGISLVPEDRLGTGLVGGMGIADNLMLKANGKRFITQYKSARQNSKQWVEKYDIATADADAPVRNMSGGNIQKVLLAREIESNPRVLMAAYPTRGLDIAAADLVYNLMLEQRDRGGAVLFVSEDMEALMSYSDRIMVMCKGKIMAILERDAFNQYEIGMLMMGTSLKEVVSSYEKFNRF